MNTLVGSGTVFEGSLNVTSSMRIDGKIKGQISCAETLLVGKTGEVEASVRVKNATIGGKVVGDIIAEEVVILEGKSTLMGDVTTKKLIIEEGAVFNGTCRMGDEVRKAPASSAQGKGADPDGPGSSEPAGQTSADLADRS
jgi:cytoskeletal protein CcmA (bactofilin family)